MCHLTFFRLIFDYFHAKIQRRFKNCKEIATFFVNEDYLTIFVAIKWQTKKEN